MKLIKSLLLGTAAGFAATAGVQAADLPSKKAAPVDYVRVCTIGSFTGFVIPGSDVCLKLGGFVRYQYTYNQPQSQFRYVPGVGGFSGARGLAVEQRHGPDGSGFGQARRSYDHRVRPAALVRSTCAWSRFARHRAGAADPSTSTRPTSSSARGRSVASSRSSTSTPTPSTTSARSAPTPPSTASPTPSTRAMASSPRSRSKIAATSVHRHVGHGSGRSCRRSACSGRSRGALPPASATMAATALLTRSCSSCTIPARAAGARLS